MSGELADQSALVTGGSRGIGRAIAIELARAGARVALTYRSGADLAASVVKEIEEAGGSAFALACDVADIEAVDAVVAEVVKRQGGLQVVVNNAGITADQLILRMKPDDFDTVVGTNLRGTWNVCKVVARPLVRARGGRIINLSSVIAQMGNAGQSNYAASKGGVEALTRSLARELASRNVTVNAVAPGFIDTDMTRGVGDAAREDLLKQIPMGRPGTGADVAAAVRFLASPGASYITGQVIHVNGGMI